MKYILHIIGLCLLFVGCGRNTEIDRQMDVAEGLMLSSPDSALHILDKINAGGLSGKEQMARYALLKSMALDKNYIDTTTFDVLQPAIDYYLDHGTPDEKLRTYFYQGRILQNREEFDFAMQCYLKAKDINDYTDTLTFANMLVAQSNLYFRSYQIDDYISNNLRAANLFEKIGNEHYVQVGLIKALDGCIISNYKDKADSILLKVEDIAGRVPEHSDILSSIKVMHLIKFGEESEVRTLLDSLSTLNSYNDEIKLNMALGYLNIKEPSKAKLMFESIDTNSDIVESIKYLSIRPKIFEANRQYEDALAALHECFIACENENENISYQKTTVAEERHKLEIENLSQIQDRDKIIWLSVCSILLLLLVIGVISYLYRLGKMKRILAEKEQSRLKLENASLQNQNSILELEKQTAELETEKRHLAIENMMLRISQLETENEQLKVLSEKDELPDDVKKVIKERIGILNALFAANILDNEPAATAYVDLVKREISDKEKFMNSNRLAFKVSHPMFIKYFEEHGLTEYEINYLCLYAIGLKGKEVGNYMELRRHYNISSDIRRKLGIDEHETNIGIYVRKLLKRL